MEDHRQTNIFIEWMNSMIIKEQANKNASSKTTVTKMEVIFSFSNRKPIWSVDPDSSLQFRDKQSKVILHSTMFFVWLGNPVNSFIFIKRSFLQCSLLSWASKSKLHIILLRCLHKYEKEKGMLFSLFLFISEDASSSDRKELDCVLNGKDDGEV